jgi:hypothetical protein
MPQNQPEKESVKDKAAATAKRAREAVDHAVTGAKDGAVEAFDKVIESLDNLGNTKHK